MQIKSIYRGARISAFKAREVTREIQGLPVAAALDVLAFTPRKAAVLISKTLKSAVANAEYNNNLARRPPGGEGSPLSAKVLLSSRFQPKARGSAGRDSQEAHLPDIRIILTDEIEIKPKRRKPRKPASKAKTARPAATKKKSFRSRRGPAEESRSGC